MKLLEIAARIFYAPVRYFDRIDREYQEQCASPTCPKCGEEKIVGQEFCGDCWAFNASAP